MRQRAREQLVQHEPERVDVARRADRLAEQVTEIEAAGGQAIAVPTDVSKESDCIKLVQAAKEAFGPADILINNEKFIEYLGKIMISGVS